MEKGTIDLSHNWSGVDFCDCNSTSVCEPCVKIYIGVCIEILPEGSGQSIDKAAEQKKKLLAVHRLSPL